MRIEVTIGGGFAWIPGLVRPLVLDTESLPPEEAAELHRLCDEALQALREQQAARRAPTPDARTYRIVIETDTGKSEVACADPLAHPVAALVAFIRVRAAAV
jgi:hypothetical protein